MENEQEEPHVLDVLLGVAKPAPSPTAMRTVGVKLPAELHAALKAQGRASGRALKHEALAQLAGAQKARTLLRTGLQAYSTRHFGAAGGLDAVTCMREALEALGVYRDKQP